MTLTEMKARIIAMVCSGANMAWKYISSMSAAEAVSTGLFLGTTIVTIFLCVRVLIAKMAIKRKKKTIVDVSLSKDFESKVGENFQREYQDVGVGLGDDADTIEVDETEMAYERLHKIYGKQIEKMTDKKGSKKKDASKETQQLDYFENLKHLAHLSVSGKDKNAWSRALKKALQQKRISREEYGYLMKQSHGFDESGVTPLTALQSTEYEIAARDYIDEQLAEFSEYMEYLRASPFADDGLGDSRLSPPKWVYDCNGG